jgi:Leucine-rich repeat (LRR) protein
MVSAAKTPDFNKKDIVALKLILLSKNNNLWEKVVKLEREKPFTFDNPVWDEIRWWADVDGLVWKQIDDKIKLTAINWGEKGIVGHLKFDGFDNLSALSCYNNNLETLEVRNLINLEQLSCFGDSLASLTLQNLPALKELYCFSNQLDTLGVGKLAALQKLSCYKNQLKSLDCNQLSNLVHLDCSTNNLAVLEIAEAINLSYLDCSLNNLDTLKIKHLTHLTHLSCYSNKLTSLDVGKLTKLTYINCFFNSLSSLNIENLLNLTYLSCWGNRIPFAKLPRPDIKEYHYEFQRIFIQTRAGARLDLSDLYINNETTTYKYANVIHYLRPDGVFIVPAIIGRKGTLEIQMTNTAFPKFLENNLPLLLILSE